MAVYVFYNPLAGGGKILEDLDVLDFVLDEACIFCDMTKPETYGEALFAIKPEDILILCGGDGTLNCFANLTADLQINNEIYYFPAGERNNFARDFGRFYGCNPFPITKYLRTLPSVQLPNRKETFMTGIVFAAASGIRRTSREKKGYNTPATLSAVVDGVSCQYEKVHFAAVVRGRFCDGVIPDPSRKPTDGDLSCVVIHGCGRLRALYLKRRMQNGCKVHSRHLAIQKGNSVTLSFAAPVCLRVDGEEHPGVAIFTAEK